MCKTKLELLRKYVSPGIPGIVAASAFIFAATPAVAQTCGNALSASPVISPISGSKVIVGQTVTITRIFFGSSDPGNCLFRNGEGYFLYPNGTVPKVVTNLNLNPPGFPPLNSALNCYGTNSSANEGDCIVYSTTYTVVASDVGKSNAIVLPPRGQLISPQTIPFPGVAGQVVFGAAADADGFNPSNPDSKTGFATGAGSQFLTVVTPGLTVTKICDTNCFLYGAPITFHGTVCNTGDIALANIVVTDSPAAVITFAALTSSGGSFIPANGLTNGECVNFTGMYQPSSNLCGPFPDTIVASGTASGVVGNPVYFATNSAVCTVCTAPALVVTKRCPPAPVAPGGLLTFSGTITNTGNVPLTNVLVFDDKILTSGTNLVVSYPLLTNGEFRVFSGTYVVPTDSCGPYSDILTALGTGLCGVTVTNTAQAICPGTNSPSIAVTKTCPPGPVQPGQLLTITGTVTNTGNITLTNVTVTNVIAAVGQSHLVLGPTTLAPEAGASFTDSYVLPLDSCGPYGDTVFASGSDKCFGRVVTNAFTTSCPGTNSPSLQVTKTCPPGLIQPGQLLTILGTVTNTGNVTLTNVIVTNSIAALGTNRLVAGPLVLAPGAGLSFTDSYIVPLDSCGPYADTLIGYGAEKCFGHIVTNAFTAFCPGTNSPGIAVTKSCPPGLVQPGQLLTITGTVTNTGNITLTNVIVTNSVAALGTSKRVAGPLTLAPGAGTVFTDSYLVPLDSCGPYSDTVTARGADKCFGRVVNNAFTTQCPGTNSPSLLVSKFCPQNPVPPGGLMVITGFVTNTGNITLTNVTVTNVIAAISQSHFVLGPITLAPGAVAAFTDQYIVPLDSCGPYRDTVFAAGEDKCFGRVATASAFRDCPGITNPRITIVKRCPPTAVPPGGLAVFSGTVSNAGNITLTNVVVVNNRPTNNTPVFGPVTLAPGQTASFTGSETVPLNCCSYFDTLTVTAANICTGSNVMATATAVCPTLTIPLLTVTKNCPPNPVPLGQPLVFTGIVSNAGNITLIGVKVVDNQLTNNTPVLGPITLAPGEFVAYSGSYVVPINICETNMTDTVTATASDVCTGSNLLVTATAVCPIVPTPRLALTKVCPPNPVPPGGLLVYSGIVSNAGTLTLTNVTVVNDRPAPNTPVLGPINLTPGQVVSFSGSYIAPYDCCGPCVDTLTARGNEFCRGSNVTATASDACPRSSTPAISVTRSCPPGPVNLGDLVFVSGSVSNSGNATLANVVVSDDQAGIVVSSIALAPSESVPFMGMYLVTNCGPNLPAGATASGSDVCTGIVVSNRFVTTCSVICGPLSGTTILGPRIAEGKFTFSFVTESNRNYTVSFTDSLSPTNWLPLTNFPGDGTLATIHDTLNHTQRYYRVQTQ